MKIAARLYLALYGLVLLLAFATKDGSRSPDLVAAAVLAAILFPPTFLPLALWRFVFRPRPRTRTGLERVLFRWPTGDLFTVAHLLTGLCIFGVIGSGKSSGSGATIARHLVNLPNSSGVIFASNPSDREEWTRRFRDAGREADLKIFSATSLLRWNILAKLQDRGTAERPKVPADARALTKYLLQVAETVTDSKGGANEQFWKQLQERIIYNAVEAIRQAWGMVDVPALARFLSGAAYAPQQLADPKWLQGYHARTLQVASEKKNKTAIEAADCQLFTDFWVNEHPALDPKVRSSAGAGISNVLHALNSGVTREILSTETNASADDFAHGIWHLWDFPVSEYGASGKALYATVKAATQRWVLQRHYRAGDPVVVLYADEAWHLINSGDFEFLSESRKHGGTLIFLTQTLANYAIALGDGADNRKSQAFVGLFGTKIFHAADPVTAAYAVSLVGEAEQDEVGLNQEAPKDSWDQINGAGLWRANVSQRMKSIMTARDYMVGLAMGGPDKVVEGWVIRNQCFAGQTNCLKVAFHQE